MNTQRPRKNFKTSDGTPEPMNGIQNFGEQSHQNQASYQKQNFNNSNNYHNNQQGASNNSKKIKKPKNKLNLNKFHQPIFKKESEGKLLKKKARDLQRLVEKEGVAEEIIESKKAELEEVTSKLEQRKKKLKRQERKIKFLQQKYKAVMNVEMKKVLRSLEKNEKLISQTLDDEKRSDLFAKKKELQMKYNYIKYFPKDKKYLSLFPKQENEKMVALRNKIMKEIQSRIEQKERYLNKIELDPKNKEELENKQKDKKQKKKVEKSEHSEEESQMDIEKDSEEDSSDEDDSDEEAEEKQVKMPKLGKKYVDNFFVAPNSGVDEKSQVKIVGKDGRVLKTQQKTKTLSDSDSSDEDSD